ncbi:MAG: TlyA family RNA methyltransferase [Longicatena sp.]
MRIDTFLQEHNYFTSRAKAQDALREQRVSVNGKRITKSSYQVDESALIEVEKSELTLASRAGFKLYDAIQDFDIDLQGRICIDVGASTGGFSDVCLKKGAAFVYAVDVGKDQLLPFLKEDDRVRNMEGINCRYLTSEMFEEKPTFACMDVSFISIKLILPSLLSIMDTKELVVLIKPQFEAGRQYVGKNGIVKDEKIHIQVLSDMLNFISDLGYYVHHLQASSILGRDGNKEFVMHIKETPISRVFPLKQIVKEYKVKR